MKGVTKKEVLYDITKTIEILEKKDIDKLKDLSNHAIEDVALHKDLDIVSITVLIYSIYKVAGSLQDEDYHDLLKNLKKAKANIERGNYGGYNRNIKNLFNRVRSCNAKVKVHLQDVMQAAKIKKGTILLKKGLSLGQAAGLMGLSNWDLQEYAGRTAILEDQHEKVTATSRLQKAFKVFNV